MNKPTDKATCSVADNMCIDFKYERRRRGLMA